MTQWVKAPVAYTWNLRSVPRKVSDFAPLISTSTHCAHTDICKETHLLKKSENLGFMFLSYEMEI